MAACWVCEYAASGSAQMKHTPGTYAVFETSEGIVCLRIGYSKANCYAQPTKPAHERVFASRRPLVHLCFSPY